jgi:hypothetical protein
MHMALDWRGGMDRIKKKCGFQKRAFSPYTAKEFSPAKMESLKSTPALIGARIDTRGVEFFAE